MKLAFASLAAFLALTSSPALACDGLPGARCGSVPVPLDRADPAAGTTTVAYALVPAEKRSRSTVLFNPGGPGAPAIADAPARLEDHDLLLIDPRGTGRSDPLRCAGSPSLAFASDDDWHRAIGACGRSLGPRMRDYGSAAVADDFDAVRAALGIDRLDLWGESYGAYLMPVYAARHPERVGRIVLSGAYPVDFDPWGRDRLAAALRICGCKRDVSAVAKRLREHPRLFGVEFGGRRYRVPLDEAALAKAVYEGGHARAIAAARRGDDALLRRVVAGMRLRRAALIGAPITGFDAAQSFATQCHDYPHAFAYSDPIALRAASYMRARDSISTAPFSPAAWTEAGFEAVDTCLYWPDDPTAAAPSLAGLPDVPVLVLAGARDANTPASAGRQAAAQFAHARFVEVPGAGHTPTNTPRGLKRALEFLAAA